MSIRENGVRAVLVCELLKENLQIPLYQRPYSWKPETALQLVDDVKDALDDHGRSDVPYVLGSVILHKHHDQFDVVDGQQRLLTLLMILAILDPADSCSVPIGIDTPVSRVRMALNRRFGLLKVEDRQRLLDFVRKRCQVVRVETDDVDEAFRVFDSQNYRGKPLAPHDLLKAHHLREMDSETDAMKVAVVETWESAKADDLDRLFSTYLYRIARWSRGESAPGFTTHDIAIFKGISRRKAQSPSARYHLAAQDAIPIMIAWTGSTSESDDREAGRCRFQLDAPQLAGRPFFEMVTFMLQELKLLAREAFAGEKSCFGLYDLERLEANDPLEVRPSSNRYRYVAELYLAALLYCTNKFGEEDLDEARQQLFVWAYALRVERLRVQFRSIDKRALGEDPSGSAFSLLRNASSSRAVGQLLATGRPDDREGHEVELAALLYGRGAQ